MTTFTNPFDGVVQGGIAELSQQFLMFYYLPTGGKIGNVTTTGPTYFTTWRSDDDISATWGVLNYTVKKGEPYALKYKKMPNGFSFVANTISGFGTSTVGFSPDAYTLEENDINLSGFTSWSFNANPTNSYTGTVFQLKQLNTNLPTDAIFSGVWYTMENNSNVVIPPVFDQSSTNIGNSPFPNLQTQTMTFTNKALLQNPYVMFIPFNTNVSYWINGACTKGSYNTPMLMVNDWILTKDNDINNSGYKPLFAQSQCFGHLGKNSQYCAYTGGTCNGGFGYQYCDEESSCGKCYGGCTGKKKGLNCIWDNQSGASSSVFYCSTLTGGSTSIDPNSTAGINTNKWALILIITIICMMLALLIIFYLVGMEFHIGHHNRGKR